MKIVHSIKFTVYRLKKTVNRQPSTKNRPGQVLVISIISMAAIVILASALFSRVSAFLNFGARSTMNEQATILAEAGVDKALWRLNQPPAGSYTGETDTPLDPSGTFTVSIADKGSGVKTITSTGYVPNSTNPRAKQIIKVDASINDRITFRYAVQLGNGGITMANSATINGTAFSNGDISGPHSASINGDAYAVGSISSPSPNISGTPYDHSSTPAPTPAPFPNIDYNFYKTLANSGNDPASCLPGSCTVCSPTCTISGGVANIGSQKFQGNLTINNNAVVTMKGPVYVTGDVIISQGGTKVNLDESYGSSGEIFITDGTVTVSQGGAFNPTSATPTKGYILVVTTSNSPTAMSISNSAANAIFYALLGGASLTQSASVSALVADSLSMINNSVLNYDSSLVTGDFSEGPGGSWDIVKGTYNYK